MWSSVAPDDIKSAAPSARSKHSATVVGDHVYLLGGRNGNLPTRDFWKYNLGKFAQQKFITLNLKLDHYKFRTCWILDDPKLVNY